MKIEEVIKSTAVLSLNKRTLLNILYTQHQLAESIGEVLKPFDLSAEQYDVLCFLKDQKGIPANMCMIQEKMLSKTSNTTRLVDKLLLKKYVTREVCSENRRKIEVFITDAGLEAIRNLNPKIDFLENHHADNLTLQELKNLNLLLEKYRAA